MVVFGIAIAAKPENSRARTWIIGFLS